MCCCCCCCWLAPPWQWGKPARCSVWSGWGSWSRGWRSPRRQGRPPIIILFNKILSVLLWNLTPPPSSTSSTSGSEKNFPASSWEENFIFKEGFFILWPTIPTNPSHWYPSMLHPSKVVFFLDSSGFCLLYYSFVCDVWELEMWYCGGEFKWIYKSSAMSECCTIQYFDAFYKS